MRTASNTKYLVKKAYNRMWLVWQLKGLEASTSHHVDAIQKQALSVLWLGAPAWFCLLTQAEKTALDMVAKVGLKIIYGEYYSGFENAIQLSGTSKPTDRLEKITKLLQLKVPNTANSVSGISVSLPPISAQELRKTNTHKYTQEQIDTRSLPSHT